ncbi:hypothetical protein [Lysobacter sp. CA196]|uniref:hypothetical protein n=1 Tax=Lysobacter sp. CA196 TaxID=3455606 RepID=UPI003F8D154C
MQMPVHQTEDSLESEIAGFELTLEISLRSAPDANSEFENPAACRSQLKAAAGRLGRVLVQELGTTICIGGVRRALEGGLGQATIVKGGALGPIHGASMIERAAAESGADMLGAIFEGMMLLGIAGGYPACWSMGSSGVASSLTGGMVLQREGYGAYVDDLVRLIRETRAMIVGESRRQSSLDFANAAARTVEIGIQKLEYLIAGVIRRSVELKAETMGFPAVSTASLRDAPLNIDGLIDALRSTAGQLDAFYSIEREIDDESVGARKVLSAAYLVCDRDVSTAEASGFERVAWQHFEGLSLWAKTSLGELAGSIVCEAARESVRLADELLCEMKQGAAASIEWRTRLKRQYNQAIQTQAAWHLFGKRLATELVDTDASISEVVSWVGTIFLPGFDSSFDGQTSEDARAEQINATVLAVVNALVKGKRDIDAVELERGLADGRFGTLREAFSRALSAARSGVGELAIKNDELVSMAGRELADASLREFDEDRFRRDMESEFASFVDRFEVSRMLTCGLDEALLEESAALHSYYMRRVAGELRKSADELALHGRAQPGRITDILEDGWGAVENLYNRFSTEGIYLTHHAWVSFAALPGVVTETFGIVEQLKSVANAWHRNDAMHTLAQADDRQQD